MARLTSKLSESEREQRRARDRERLKVAAEQLLTSQGWERWVHVRSRNGLSRYSLNNQLLIALARPDATFVAGFRSWLELGYQVRKGEKAIWILAPLKIKERDRASGEETGETRTLFRAVPVFDRAQVTAGEHATPLEPPAEPLSGDSHQHLLVPLQHFAGTLGFAVSFEPIDGPAGGWCDYKRKRIVVGADQPANARVRVLIPWRRWCIRTFGMHPRAVVVLWRSRDLSCSLGGGQPLWASDRRRGASCVARGGAGVPGTDVEIGGGSPVPGP